MEPRRIDPPDRVVHPGPAPLRGWQDFIEWEVIDKARAMMIEHAAKTEDLPYEKTIHVHSGPYAGMKIVVSYDPTM